MSGTQYLLFCLCLTVLAAGCLPDRDNPWDPNNVTPGQRDGSVPDLKSKPDISVPEGRINPDRARPDVKAWPDIKVMKDLTKSDSKPVSNCGDGVVTGTEQCDGNNLNKKTCQNSGYSGGVLKCKSCKLDFVQCYKLLDSNGIQIAGSTDSIGYPRVATGGSDFMVTWEDGLNMGPNNNDVYWVNISNSGKVLSTKASSLASKVVSRGAPAIVYNGSGYLIVWHQTNLSSTSSNDIYGIRVDKAGKIVDAKEFPVCSHTGSQIFPSIAYDGANYFVAWGDHRNGQRDVYGALLNKSGKKIGADVPVSTSSGHKTWTTIAFNGTNYLVAWGVGASQWVQSDIYGSRISTIGKVLDTNPIAISAGAHDEFYPSVASDGNSYLITWADSRNGTLRDIYGAIVDGNGKNLNPMGIAIKTGKANSSWLQSVTFDATKKKYFVFWSEDPGGKQTNCDIHGARLDINGNLLDASSIQVSTAAGCQSRTYAASHGGLTLAVWE